MKVPRKIFKKVFIIKKFTQCKTSRSLKLDVFEIPHNKNIGKFALLWKTVFVGLLFLHLVCIIL